MRVRIWLEWSLKTCQVLKRARRWLRLYLNRLDLPDIFAVLANGPV